MAPRSILKAELPSFTHPSSSSSTNTPLPFAWCKPNLLSPHVHFPPTPSMASTQATHSSSTYDRAPIAVTPNSCELPERGGRVYSPGYVQPASQVAADDYFDPLSFKACTGPVTNVPPLIPDVSSSSCSESDESDEYSSPSNSSPNMSFSPNHTSLYSLPSPFSQEEFAYALSFLPHPPSLVKDNDHSSLIEDSNRKPPLMKNKGRRGSETLRLKRKDSMTFEEQNLAGCLGGF